MCNTHDFYVYPKCFQFYWISYEYVDLCNFILFISSTKHINHNQIFENRTLFYSNLHINRYFNVTSLNIF